MAALGLDRKVPVLLQTEATECGLCSIARVAYYHGHRTDLATLRLRFSISRKGATLESLMTIARALNLESRPLKLDMEHLPELRLPCILHWDMDHFVVLTSLSARGAVIHDPAAGERRFALKELGKHFTGVALELTPSTDFVASTEQLHFTLHGLMGRITGMKRGLIQILILALGFGLLVLIQAAIGAVRSWFVTALSTSLNFQWLGNVFSHLVKLPLEYYEKRHIGSILSRFGSITTIQKTLTTGFVQALVDGIMVLGTFAMMLLYSPGLAIVAVVAVVLYALVRWSVYRSLRAATAEQIIHAAKETTHFLETASGIQSVRLFGKGEQRRAGWMNMLADQFNAELRVQRISIGYETAQTLLFGIERIIIIYLAALAVIDNRLTIGMLFAFIAYKDQFSLRLAALIDRVLEFMMLRLHGERVADIAMSETEAGAYDVAGEADLTRIEAGIELRGVSFRFSPTEPYVIENINLSKSSGSCWHAPCTGSREYSCSTKRPASWTWPTSTASTKRSGRWA